MTRAFRAELLRLSSRRLFRVLALLILLLVIGLAMNTFVRSTNDPRAGFDAARREVESCQRQRAAAINDGSPEAEKFFCPTVDQIRPEFDNRFRYSQTFPNTVRGVAAALITLGFIVGAAFMGAEWGTGSMTTLLTWEPRRWAVLISKLCACVACVALFGALLLAFITLVFYPVAAIRGITTGITGAWWRDMVFTWLRGAGIASIGGALGIGAATIARNTAGAMAGGFVYGAIADNLLAVAWAGRFRNWTVNRNIASILGVQVTENPDQFGRIFHMTSIKSSVVLSVYALIVIAISYALFQSRDVT